jgi:predicted nucleic acid-binding protein
LRQWLANGEAIGVATIVWTEYLCGPLAGEKVAAADALTRRKEPFLTADAPLAARLFNAGGRRRGTLTDCMIAAVAIRCHAAFATLNRDDFAPFVAHGLELV